ncbi:MAG TPA: penicillin-binding transpeptidase domain-containing protein [Solirubrobacteraceae bacterium]
MAVGALALVAAAVAFAILWREAAPPGPRDTLNSYLTAWTRGDDTGAAALTDNPRAATAALRANRRGLDGARVHATLAAIDSRGGDATGTVRVRWDVPAIGPWSYQTKVALYREGRKWHIAWRPTAIHPRLSATGMRLGTVRDDPERAPILARDGAPLISSRPVVRVGIDRATVHDIDATAADLATVLHVNAADLARAARRAGPKQFVEALTLRAAEYAPLAERLAGIQGVQTVKGTAQLAPSRAFARALLGSVAPATAEQIAASHGALAVGDEVGQWGMEARYDRRLAGTATRRIVIRRRGVPTATLFVRRGTKGRSVRTTLDRAVQRAAETALDGRNDEAALVAVKPSTGDILAVANRPTDSTYDRAIEGRYPPGSTFKVVSTTALLRDGLRPAETVACPKTITVGGKQFRNFEGEAAGDVPFAQDFAQSCNTAFVSLASRLSPGALTSTARLFGLGRTPASQVPPGRDAAARAATMIGQDRILASPLAMAGVAATVADGRWRAPRLLATDPHKAGPPLRPGELSTLRSLMRLVVTSGTGAALAGLPGEIAGKTGTAEFGTGNPPPTHAWFIAYRGDLAVAVLVGRGQSGASVAAPLAQRFFEALPLVAVQ